MGKDLKAELIKLVHQNILAYNPVTAVFSLKGKSMEIGLNMYIERSAKRLGAQQTKNTATQLEKWFYWGLSPDSLTRNFSF